MTNGPGVESAALRAEIESLQDEVAALRAREPRSSRRRLLQLAGAAVAGGGAAVALGVSPAAAATVAGDGGTGGDGVTGTTASSTVPRSGVWGNATDPVSYGISASHTAGGTALYVTGSSTSVPTATISNASTGSAIVASNYSTTKPAADIANNSAGTAMRVRSSMSGIEIYDAKYGVWSALSQDGAVSVTGTSQGVGGVGVSAAASGNGGQGIAVTGADTTIFMGVTSGVPQSSSWSHIPGALMFDPNNDFWLCIEGGTPGKFRKLAGQHSAGAFHAISPSRVYDSRRSIPDPGVVLNGSWKDISVASRRDLGDGHITTFDIVPAGATAVAVNVTITGTVGSGYIGVNEGLNHTLSASTLNWATSGVTAANMIIVPVNASRQVSVVCGPTGAAHVILDVSGYYL